jgi:hypothetical protein
LHLRGPFVASEAIILPPSLKSIRDWNAEFVTSDREGDELKEYPALVAGAPIEIPARSVVTLAAQFT